jgi:hypothetical protein
MCRQLLVLAAELPALPLVATGQSRAAATAAAASAACAAAAPGAVYASIWS